MVAAVEVEAEVDFLPVLLVNWFVQTAYEQLLPVDYVSEEISELHVPFDEQEIFL